MTLYKHPSNSLGRVSGQTTQTDGECKALVYDYLATLLPSYFAGVIIVIAITLTAMVMVIMVIYLSIYIANLYHL